MKNESLPLPTWLLLSLLCLITGFHHAKAQTLPANFQRVSVATGLSNGTNVAFLPDGRILVCQQTGQLRVIKNGALLATPALTLSVNTSGERGLLGVAVDPNFATNQYIYIYYTHTSGPHNRVSRFTMTGDTAGSELTLLDLPTLSAIYHNGGGLAFGNDGKLYVCVGDNKSSASAQNLDSYLGKLLRINSDGTVPAGNPFTGGAPRSRVWAYGLRNPFTLASDPTSGKVYVNDVGEATWEEVNDATTGGRNFGWPNAEGNSSNSSYTNPVYIYSTNRSDPPSVGQGCAINGGTFLRASITNYPTTYHGKYFFVDYCGSWIDYINPAVASPGRSGFATGAGDGMTNIKQNPNDGNLYYLNRGNSTLYKIVYNGTAAPVITQQPQSITVAQGGTATFTVTATGTPAPTYQWRKNGTNISGATAATYSIANVQPSHAGGYSAVVTNTAGSATSTTATLTVTAPNTAPVAVINSPANNAPYRWGDVVSFSGSATDAEDGTVPATRFEWVIIFHHASHTHPGPDVADGVASGSFVTGEENEAAADIFYRIYLIATDSQGAVDSAAVDIRPVTSTLSLNTNPAGLQIRLDGIVTNTPMTAEAISGMPRPVEAISPQTTGGVTYLFDHWSQGGPAAQTITITDSDASYTAHYRVAPAPVLLAPTHDAYVRDGTNAAITHGTTDPTVLITKVSPAGQLNNNRDSYLKFDLSSISGTVASVVLKVYGKLDLTTVPSVPVGVFSVANTTWTESAITWNNKPATGATPLASVTVSNAAFVYYNWDITNYVQSERAAGRNVISLALKSQAAHDPRVFWNSKEATSNPPQLSVIAETGGNVPPTASVTSPANGTVFTQPVNIPISASASDSDGTITKVEFFEDGTKLGEDLSSPYTFTWNSAPAGTHSLTVVATDNGGAAITSAAVSITVNPPPTGLPAPWSNADIGAVAAAGSATYSAGTFTVNGSGADIWAAADEFHFVSQPASGDVEVTARVSSITNTNGFAKAGAMIRESSGAGSANALVAITPANGVTFQRRTATGATSVSTRIAGITAPVWVRVKRTGNTFAASYSADGITWTTIGSEVITMAASVQVGLAVTSHADGTLATGPFTDVSVTSPCAEVTASADDGNVAANVLDNDLNTRWSASGDGQWIQFCLGAVSPVSGVQIAFYKGNERSSTFDVLVSSDGSTFTTAATGLASSGTSLALENFSFTSVNARHVRIVGHGNNLNLWNSYTEVRISTGAALASAEPASLVQEALSSHPNPAKGTVNISYTVKAAGRVTLSVYDAAKSRTIILVDKKLDAGTYQLSYDTKELSNGINVLRLEQKGESITSKLIRE